jgi:hypothetical protein
MLTPLLWLIACDQDFTDPARQSGPPLSTGREYPTVIHEPTAYGVLEHPITADPQREIPAGTACTACHGPTPELEDAPVATGEAYHTDVTVSHGDLSCAQCHDPDDRSQLHLADDTVVPFLSVMTLCAQCHGTQHRDYLHGAHGGMSGFWDTQRGARLRNNCVDCHAPHDPAYARVLPVFPPADRVPPE